jgi:FeS assembly protein IscX
MKWTDIEDIAETLNEHHPEVDVMRLRFTDLHRYVTELPGFNDLPDKSNERILEAIQAAWFELKS